MFNGTMDGDGFQIVERKRGRRPQEGFSPPFNNIMHTPLPASTPVDVNRAVKRITDFRSEISSSAFYCNCVQTLKKSLRTLEEEKKKSQEKGDCTVESLVCYGLGNFTQCSIACYQLALFLCLKHDLRPRSCFVFDPVFLNTEEEILTSLDLVVIGQNEEGKRRVTSRTLFYLPHCGKALYNNLLWANWGLPLTRLVVLGNSFNRVFETASKGVLRDRWPYLLRAAAHAQEFAVVNNFRYRDVFNDLSIHIFPVDKINSFPAEYWQDCEEPVYDGNEIEIITNEMMKHFKQI